MCGTYLYQTAVALPLRPKGTDQIDLNIKTSEQKKQQSIVPQACGKYVLE